MNNKTVLVTGATGLLGYNLVNHIISMGGKVIALGRSAEKLSSCFRDYLGKDCFSYIAKELIEEVENNVY